MDLVLALVQVLKVVVVVTDDPISKFRGEFPEDDLEVVREETEMEEKKVSSPDPKLGAEGVEVERFLIFHCQLVKDLGRHEVLGGGRKG